jgi:lysophospholipase L1-like esterase
MHNPTDTATAESAENHSKPQVSLKRRLAYIAIIYLAFLLVLLGIEVGTRLTTAHVSSLDLFVATPQQRAQVANAEKSVIFEGDPLLLWRLKPNLDHAVWDFTVLSTNGQHLRADHPLQSKQPGTIRIVCLGDSVTFGYRVPVVWPDRPKDYNPDWLPFPMLLEKHLGAANPNRKIEVIAMAVPGYTSHQGLAWLLRDIDKFQPDLLTVSFGWNDASFSDVPDRESIRTNWYVVGTRWLIDHSQAFAHATRWLRSRQQIKPPAGMQPVARVSQQEYLDNMLGIANLARQRGLGLIVIAAPYRDRVTNVPEADLMLSYRVALRTTMEQHGVPFLEIPELTEGGYPSNLGLFGELIHPNHLGHRLLASELLKVIGSNRMLNDLNVPPLTP